MIPPDAYIIFISRMKEADLNEIQILDYKEEKVDLRCIRGPQKIAIVNFPTQPYKSSFGRASIESSLQTQQIFFRNDGQKKSANKKEIQNLKFSMTCQKKPKKIFLFNIPKNRGVKKNNESKMHFILELSRNNSLLSVIDEYAEARMIVKGGLSQTLTTQQMVDREKKRLDGRRKKDIDEQQLHKDPDFDAVDDASSD